VRILSLVWINWAARADHFRVAHHAGEIRTSGIGEHRATYADVPVLIRGPRAGSIACRWSPGSHSTATEKVQKVIVPQFGIRRLVARSCIPSMWHASGTSAHVILQNRIQRVLAQAIAGVPGERLADVKLVPKRGKTTATPPGRRRRLRGAH